MATTVMSVACFLVAHPKGTLMWDVAAFFGTAPSRPALRNAPCEISTSTKTLKARTGSAPGRTVPSALALPTGTTSAMRTCSRCDLDKAEHEIMFAEPPSATHRSRPS